MDRQEYREFQSNNNTRSLIAFYKKHKRMPSESSKNTEEIALSCMLEEKMDSYQNNDNKNKFFDSDIKMLEEAGIFQEVMDVVRPNTHLKNSKEFFNFVNNRPFNASLTLDYKTWAKWRNWYYTFYRRPHNYSSRLDDFFQTNGYGRLLQAKMDSPELKQFIYAVQIAKWHEQHNALPNPKGRTLVEKQLAKVIDKGLCNHALEYLATKNIKLQGINQQSKPKKTEQVVAVIPQQEDKRINKLERMVENLTQLVTSLLKNPRQKKEYSSSGEYAVKDESLSSKKTMQSSELLGLAVYDQYGTTITCGIENIITYHTGTSKYILRRPNPDGTFGTRFYSWSTCKYLKEVILNKTAV